MKKWLFLGWILTGCIFTENSGSGDKWLNELGIDSQQKVKSLKIENFNVGVAHSREWAPRSGRAADTVFYQAEYSIGRNLQNRLLLGTQAFENDPDSISYELQLHFDVSDSLNQGTKAVRDSLYHDPDKIKGTLELTVSPNFYGSTYNNSLTPPDELSFEIEWLLTTWAPLRPDLVGDQRSAVDSLLYDYDYWQKILAGETEVAARGTLIESVERIAAVSKDTLNGIEVLDTLRTYFEIHFSKELEEALVAHRDEFMSLSMKVRAQRTGAPLYVASPDISSFRPQLVVKEKVNLPAVFAAFQGSADAQEGTVYSGVGDTLLLAPDFDQIAEALKNEGIEGPGNLDQLILNGKLSVKWNTGSGQLVSPRGHGAWLRIYSVLDSISEKLSWDKVAEYQLPVNDSVLQTPQASFWIPADSAVTELSWLVSYGLRRWLNYGSDQPAMAWKLVLVSAIQPGDSLRDGNYDPYDQPLKFEMGNLDNLQWSLDLLTLDPEAKQ